MPLTLEQTQEIEAVLKESLRRKFQNYNPEPAAMPFHTRLLGRDRMALFSFIHSLNTNFGTTIFEPVAQAIAAANFRSVSPQQEAGTQILSEAQRVIQDIIDALVTAKAAPNKPAEIDAIRAVCQSGELRRVRPTKVDLKVVRHDGTIFLFDIKTAKPNAGGFKEFKRTLLEWIAVTLAVDPTAIVHSVVAIPYNPYEPQPYNRWTIRGMLDLDNELKVAEEFWDFLGGQGAYQQLLDVFENVGQQLRPEIDEYFARHNRPYHQ